MLSRCGKGPECTRRQSVKCCLYTGIDSNSIQVCVCEAISHARSQNHDHHLGFVYKVACAKFCPIPYARSRMKPVALPLAAATTSVKDNRVVGRALMKSPLLLSCVKKCTLLTDMTVYWFISIHFSYARPSPCHSSVPKLPYTRQFLYGTSHE